MIKTIFFDIDNTFYDHITNKVQDSTWDACNQLHKNDIKVVLCTARGLVSIQDLGLLDAFKFDGIIANNGALVYDENLNVIFDQCFPIPTVKEIFKIAKDNKVVMQSLGAINFISDTPDFYVYETSKNYHYDIPEIYEYKDENLYNLMAYGKPEQLLDIFKDIKDLNSYASSTYTIDFVDPNLSKLEGIHTYLQYIHHEDDEFMAFGDSMNDKEMIENANVGVVMGNGDSALFPYAKEVCGPSNSDAIYETLKKYKCI